jgi:hypothetical protein
MASRPRQALDLSRQQDLLTRQGPNPGRHSNRLRHYNFSGAGDRESERNRRGIQMGFGVNLNDEAGALSWQGV